MADDEECWRKYGEILRRLEKAGEALERHPLTSSRIHALINGGAIHREPQPPAHARHAPDLPKELGNEEIDLWVASLPPADQKIGAENLWRRAASHFSPRTVVRKQFDKFGIGVGRPKKTPR